MKVYSALYAIGVATALLLAGGCSTALVFTTSTMTGIEVSTVEGGQQSIKVGYDRSEGVIMPMRKEGGKLRENAFPVLSIYEMDTGPLLVSAFTTTTITQVFATGEAANQEGSGDAVARAFSGKYAADIAPEEVMLPVRALMRALRSNDEGVVAKAVEAVRTELDSSVTDQSSAIVAVGAAKDKGEVEELNRAVRLLNEDNGE